jgi:hypothetical protein
MATGDPNAPEDHEKSRPGGSNPDGDLDAQIDRFDDRDHDGTQRRRRRGLSPGVLALELEDGRLVGDVIAEFGVGVFAGSGLRLADGRLAETVVGPFGPFGSGVTGGLDGLGTFGGFRLGSADAKSQFALRERMRGERLAALSRLGFRNTVLTGPQGVTGAAPTRRGRSTPV